MLYYYGYAILNLKEFCLMWYLPHSQVHNDRTVPIKILAIRPLNKRYSACFSMCMRDAAIFLLPVTIGFLNPDFLKDSKISAIRVPSKADIGLSTFVWIFRTSWHKMAVLGGQMGEGVVRCWPQRAYYYFGGSYVCTSFSESRSRNATVRVRIDWCTDTLTDAN